MTRKEFDILQEVHQAVFGVSGSEEKGIVGNIREIKNLVKEQNGRINMNDRKIAKHSERISLIYWIGGSSLLLVIGGLVGLIFKMLGA